MVVPVTRELSHPGAFTATQCLFLIYSRNRRLQVAAIPLLTPERVLQEKV